METRMEMQHVNPESYAAMFALEKCAASSKLPAKLKELIKIRASQINGCAFCLNMHTKDARKLGESEARIYGLNAWRESPFYTPEERAVLAFTESVTLVTKDQVPDAIYEGLQHYFSDKEISDIILCIITINAWNRIAISTRLMPQE
ncbi:alkyl hydroperoxide reductase AhpD [Pullulanibacillus camelliae]|uniref:Alkyl hydroperoxide reductase AhpD n=1 Tax=Pullulanibacillus camelliae TaxID=1707096 RepID=A0A8J2YLR1_9BACL|nr:carboxymuconolactone decarboxylase family protein [Pullulanibacillus camelliae]GGE53663.1 alkyl hydroperoxide reductase AhpD [Pullulanibacillus camelliae]